MSELYGVCRSCMGPNCVICNGSGFNGDAQAYTESQFRNEWLRDYKAYHRGMWNLSEYSARMKRADEDFYSHVPITSSMTAAVNAFRLAIARQRQKKEKKMLFKDDLGGSSGVDSKNFLKLKDKESAVGVFRGQPYDFQQHWTDNRSTPCTGATCLLCKAKKPSFRFRLNFITKDASSQYVVKIFEQGRTVYEQLRSLQESGYPLEKTLVKITRNGTGQQNTTYVILPVPGQTIGPQAEANLSTLTLHDLANIGAETQPNGPLGDTPPPIVDDIPF